MVSSLDDNNPALSYACRAVVWLCGNAAEADNIIDGREDTYWISTGLYPQAVPVSRFQGKCGGSDSRKSCWP